MKIIMTEELIERIDPEILSARGIVVNSNWKSSKLTTLRDLINTIMLTLPNALWLIDVDGEKESEEPAPAAVAAEEKPAEGGAAEPERPKEEKTQTLPEGFAAYEPKRPARRKTLEDRGKWDEYRRRALTTSEQNEVIKGMTEEGFSTTIIAQVIRTSPQTVCNRRQRMGIAQEKEAQADG